MKTLKFEIILLYFFLTYRNKDWVVCIDESPLFLYVVDASNNKQL
jgi:hypothetical protein